MKNKGFTLVELVITIAIVIILSVVSVPIYEGYVEKAMLSEGYGLLGLIVSAQKAYYSEYGNFLKYADSSGTTNYDPVLGVDARGNKYFTLFYDACGVGDGKLYFDAHVYKPEELRKKGPRDRTIGVQLNLNKGIRVINFPEEDSEDWASWYRETGAQE